MKTITIFKECRYKALCSNPLYPLDWDGWGDFIEILEEIAKRLLAKTDILCLH
jgi:hypothetical protein